MKPLCVYISYLGVTLFDLFFPSFDLITGFMPKKKVADPHFFGDMEAVLKV